MFELQIPRSTLLGLKPRTTLPASQMLVPSIYLKRMASLSWQLWTMAACSLQRHNQQQSYSSSNHFTEHDIQPGNSGLLQVYAQAFYKKKKNTYTQRRLKFPGRNVVFNKTIAGRRRTLSVLNVKPARLSVKSITVIHPVSSSILSAGVLQTVAENSFPRPRYQLSVRVLMWQGIRFSILITGCWKSQGSSLAACSKSVLFPAILHRDMIIIRCMCHRGTGCHSLSWASCTMSCKTEAIVHATPNLLNAFESTNDLAHGNAQSR